MRRGLTTLAATAVVALFGLTGAAQAQAPGHGQMFGNYYSQGFANQATAQMYVAPVPVPTWVGHTFYTYPPLNPHEMMYLHNHRYHNYYDGGLGLNRTGVHYGVPPVRTAAKRIYKAISIPRP